MKPQTLPSTTIKALFYSSLLLVWLAACTATPSPTATPTESLPPPTPTSLPTSTALPTNTPAPTATPEPSPTPTWLWVEPTQPPTVTPMALVTADPNAETLRAYAQKRNFYIGVAVNNGLVNEPEYAEVLGREFNMLVTENAMKFGLIHPEPGRYDFAPADEIVNFAQAHGMKVRGHNLVWQQQMPNWLYYGDWTRERLMEVLHNHISTVVGRYRGQVYAWDVVNEGEMAGGGLGRTFWYNNIGPDYIDLAFQWAHEADPDALLFYNEYGAESMTKKANGVYELVKSMKEGGIPIDGVGMQFHVELGALPPLSEVADNIQRLGELGLQVHITELDIRIADPVTPEKLELQAQNYRDILEMCLATPNCTAFVMWGMTDKYSWIPQANPGFGSALIFDEHYQPKPAFEALLEVLKVK